MPSRHGPERDERESKGAHDVSLIVEEFLDGLSSFLRHCSKQTAESSRHPEPFGYAQDRLRPRCLGDAVEGCLKRIVYEPNSIL